MFVRGDIYFCDLSPVVGSEQGGVRPCVVIQNNVGSKYAPTLIVAPVTSRSKKPLPTHVVVSKEETDLAREGTILCEQIRTIDKRRVQGYIGSCSQATIEAINVAIKISLALD